MSLSLFPLLVVWVSPCPFLLLPASLVSSCLSPGLPLCPRFSVSLRVCFPVYLPMPLSLPVLCLPARLLVCLCFFLLLFHSAPVCFLVSAMSLFSHEAPHLSASVWTPPASLSPQIVHGTQWGGATDMRPQWHCCTQFNISQGHDLAAYPRPEFIPGPVMGHSLTTGAVPGMGIVKAESTSRAGPANTVVWK